LAGATGGGQTRSVAGVEGGRREGTGGTGRHEQPRRRAPGNCAEDRTREDRERLPESVAGALAAQRRQHVQGEGPARRDRLLAFGCAATLSSRRPSARTSEPRARESQLATAARRTPC